MICQLIILLAWDAILTEYTEEKSIFTLLYASDYFSNTLKLANLRWFKDVWSEGK